MADEEQQSSEELWGNTPEYGEEPTKAEPVPEEPEPEEEEEEGAVSYTHQTLPTTPYV